MICPSNPVNKSRGFTNREGYSIMKLIASAANDFGDLLCRCGDYKTP